MTSVYFIVGTPGSGRRSIVRDLIENGLGEQERAVVLIAGSESADLAERRLAVLPKTEIKRWEWTPDGFPAVEGMADATIFLLADSRVSPIDQVEALKPWLAQQGAELARIFVTVDCQWAEKHPVLKPWFAACIHFADVVFLTKREGVANKWLSDFRAHFDGQFYPCLFELVKGGKVKNPALVLDPLARRMSHAFDLEQDWVFTDAEGEEIEEDEESDGDEEIEATPAVDPYFVRDAANRREKKIPDISKFL